MRRSHVLTAAGLLLVACAGPEEPNSPGTRSTIAAESIPAAAPSIRGIITAIEQDGRIRVEEQPDEAFGSAKAVIRVDDARILQRDGRHAESGDLAVGQRVSAWFTGPVAESYPVQARAAVVVIEASGP